jgi:DNA (cytosine-5)-methyltransferase 1
VVDIGMRMLTPDELAAAQGFPASYILTGTKAQKIKRIGNSVCPPVAAAIACANIPRPQKIKRGAA